jgi:hypothetical protein
MTYKDELHVIASLDGVGDVVYCVARHSEHMLDAMGRQDF